MMRRDFGCHGMSIFFRPADKLDAPGGADVLHVIPAADRAIEQQIAGDHELLGLGGNRGQAERGGHQPRVHGAAGEARLFAMLHEDGVEHLCSIEAPCA